MVPTSQNPPVAVPADRRAKEAGVEDISLVGVVQVIVSFPVRVDTQAYWISRSSKNAKD